MPFLSVLIPVYNGERYLGSAIESALNQPCKDLEIIVANDGSTDNSLAIARQYADKDDRIRVVSHENVGPGQTRNEVIPDLNGKWTIFLDCDDQILPNFYTEQLKSFLEYCIEKEIETIVPCRLCCTPDLTKANMEYVPFDEVFESGSDASWRIDYEFATLLYFTPMLKREHIVFSTTRPAEMESIFRHKAAFCSKRCLFTNKIWFAMRRENPHQTTKSKGWGTERVDRIRFQEYGKLIEWHAARGTTGYVIDEARRKRDAAEIAIKNAGVKPTLRQRIEEYRGVKRWRAERKKTAKPIADYILDEPSQAHAISELVELIERA